MNVLCVMQSIKYFHFKAIFLLMHIRIIIAFAVNSWIHDSSADPQFSSASLLLFWDLVHIKSLKETGSLIR